MYYNNGGYTGSQQLGGNIGISGQFLGVPVLYWLIGIGIYIAFKKRL
jgi:hypothetical protein